jgi:hypothetical protein
MMNFCTLFDSFYLSRGLALYDSIKEHTEDFHLYIFAFDDITYEILNKLNLDHLKIISLKEFENKDLLNVKKTRTRAEYCWTSTSSIIAYVIDNFNVPSVTYLDADLFFYKSPEILINEIPFQKSILITEHRYSYIARIFEQKRAGRFCVQFITFSNTKAARDVLQKWIVQCLDWCYSRYEDGKFGDQKYLDTWPEEYQNVHILENAGGGIAPWNVMQYKFFKDEDDIFGIAPKANYKFNLIFYHFHFVRISKKGYADIGWNRIPKYIIDMLYKPYIKKIEEKEKYLEERFHEYKTTYFSEKPIGFKENIKHFFKKITGFNIIKYPIS